MPRSSVSSRRTTSNSGVSLPSRPAYQERAEEQQYAPASHSSLLGDPSINMELLQLVARHAPLELDLLRNASSRPVGPASQPAISLRGTYSQAGSDAPPSRRATSSSLGGIAAAAAPPHTTRPTSPPQSRRVTSGSAAAPGPSKAAATAAEILAKRRASSSAGGAYAPVQHPYDGVNSGPYVRSHVARDPKVRMIIQFTCLKQQPCCPIEYVLLCSCAHGCAC